MKCMLSVVAVVLGFAAAASASSFSVVTVNSLGVETPLIAFGETFQLKFTGNALPEGSTNCCAGIFGQLSWDGSITGFITNSQTPMFATVSPLVAGDGSSFIMNQSNTANTAPSTTAQIATVTLIVDGPGSSLVQLSGEAFEFFGTYLSAGQLPVTVHSFTVVDYPVPEPATAALIGLGLLGLVLGCRRGSP